MRLLLPLFLLIGSTTGVFAQAKQTISGYVREKGSGELLIGVSVFENGTSVGTSSNTYGFYSLTLPAADSAQLVFSYIGYKQETRTVPLRQPVELNVELAPNATLKEVEIVTSRQVKVTETPQMSTIELPVAQIKNIPALMGEKDVLKVLQLMPGVQKGSEGNSGIYVRGADQTRTC